MLPTVSPFHYSMMTHTTVFEESEPKKFSLLSLSPSLAKSPSNAKSGPNINSKKAIPKGMLGDLKTTEASRVVS
ncbi:hypothetical protein PVK06_017192 [Gossypium arboreum]|uniref:Uncharacterized protein n=1 Tax=Gossypium arboreum TaxID=29729 RepID=A0ABR0Q2H4_GOSAR|nr:hypothetical protein PVK06_017192 [Gossypium arboreum]